MSAISSAVKGNWLITDLHFHPNRLIAATDERDSRDKALDENVRCKYRRKQTESERAAEG